MGVWPLRVHLFIKAEDSRLLGITEIIIKKKLNNIEGQKEDEIPASYIYAAIHLGEKRVN